ncbi:MAG: hypothetical protein ACOYO1_18430 [Bacteroidales bacterium]
MGKRSLIIVAAVMLWSLGFSQKKENQVKVFFGNLSCDKQIEVTRDQILKEGKLTFVVNDIDTVKTVSYTMQLLKGDDLSAKLPLNSPVFTLRIKNYFKYNKYEAKTKKIWVENIKIDYMGETYKLPMFTMLVKD